jgi:hypothetical protein
MSKTKCPERVRVTTDGPDHLIWRSELLAELAIMRVGELTIFKPPRGGLALPFQFVAVSSSGSCFAGEVAAYSSCLLKIEPESIAVLELEVDAERVRTARQIRTPTFMFLFDADRDHGRYLRLDTQPKPADGAKTVVLSFPVANAITADSVRALVVALEKERAVPVAG